MRGRRKAGQPRLAVGAHDKRFVEPEILPPGRAAPVAAAARPFVVAWLAILGGILVRLFDRIRQSVQSQSLRPAYDPTLVALTRQRELLTEILLVIPSAGIMVLTYYGVALPLTETGSTVAQKGQALFFALSVGVFAWLAWFYLFGLIYRLSGKRLAGALLAGTVMVGTLAAIDAPFNMLALAGGPATQMSLVDMAHGYEKARDAAMARVLKVRQLLPAILVQAKRFANLKAEEIRSGTFSGKAAPGKVSAAFGQIADQLNGLADQLDAGLGKTTALQEQLNVALGELKSATYRSSPMRGRMEAASAAGDRIDGLLTQAGQYDFGASIEATLASLDSSLQHAPAGAQTVSAAVEKAVKGARAGKGATSNSSFAQTQAAEIDAIAAMVKPVAEELRGGLAGLKDQAVALPEPLRPESPFTAIRTYWRPLLPHWCAALFIDLAPGGLLLILIAAWREADRRKDSDRTSPALHAKGDHA